MQKFGGNAYEQHDSFSLRNSRSADHGGREHPDHAETGGILLERGSKQGCVPCAIGPDMELTIIMEEDAPSVLPCFDEDDALISVKGAPLFISYNPAQVLKLAGKRYLTGPVIFYRTDGHRAIVSLTVEDIYRFQTYLESHSTTLMADGQKLTCICID